MSSLEEEQRAHSVDVNMFEEISGLDLRCGCEAGHARVGDDYVERVDAILGFERRDGSLGVVLVGALNLDDDELAVGADGEGREGFAGFVFGVAHAGDDEVVGLREVVRDKTAADTCMFESLYE